jgi:hypothetical protein
MAREGMSNLLTRFRRLVDDSGTAVWTQDQLQDVLDENKTRVWREPLEVDMTRTSGTTYVYTEYHSRYDNFEEGGTAYFKIEDSAGSARGTADYTVDYIAGRVTMNADQEGTALYLTAWSYDMNAAAAQCWRERATKVSSYYDFQADGVRMNRSQWFQHCQETAAMYAKQSRPVTVRQWHVGDYGDM